MGKVGILQPGGQQVNFQHLCTRQHVLRQDTEPHNGLDMLVRFWRKSPAQIVHLENKKHCVCKWVNKKHIAKPFAEPKQGSKAQYKCGSFHILRAA